MIRLILRYVLFILAHISVTPFSAQAFLSAGLRPHSCSCIHVTNNANNDDANESVTSPNKTARDVVVTCMDGLLTNDSPWANAGLEVCWDYSSDNNRAAQGGSLDEFITYASNPTFATMVNAKDYSIENVGRYIPGTNTRGAMQTVLVKVQSSKGEERSFLW